MSTKTIYLNPNDVENFETLTSVNTITIKPLENAVTSFLNVKNSVVALLQGKHIEQVDYADIDNANNVGKFSINTSNQIVFIVDNVTVTSIHEAQKYVWGIVVRYQKKQLKYTDDIPTYVMRTYTDDNVMISETVPSPIPELINKMKCLDNALSLDDCRYRHIFERNVI